jgi:zinc/manganese transport system substrate-binding protein
VVKVLVIVAALGLVTTACANPPANRASAVIRVVAAENFWGSLASQLGGARVKVTSVIDNPDTDPHDYEPTPADARGVASAAYVVLNGIGYDPWASQLVAANPVSNRRVLDVGRLLGKTTGDNPHRWYFPDDVERVTTQITADYKRLDPTHAAYFDLQRVKVVGLGLETYRDYLAGIKAIYAGTPVGASESMFAGIAASTGLDLKTPASFMAAISEGDGPTAADKKTVDAQIANHQIKVLVYNTQNSTPDVKRLVEEATAKHVPVVAITETPPAHTSFQDWQVRQLQELTDALAGATGR